VAAAPPGVAGLKRLLIVVAILLVAGWAVWQAGRPSEGMQTMPSWEAPQLAAATTVAIGGAGLDVQLARADSGWQVIIDGKPVAANGEAVDRLLHDLQAMRPVRVVAHSHAHDTELHLDAAQAVRVTVKDAGGKSLLELAVGGQGSDLVSTYLRRGDEAAAVAVDRALLWQLKRAPAAWKAVAKPAVSGQPAAKGEGA